MAGVSCTSSVSAVSCAVGITGKVAWANCKPSGILPANMTLSYLGGNRLAWYWALLSLGFLTLLLGLPNGNLLGSVY